jgi:thiol-disulfide isomerase/thioredoxin
MRKRNGLFFLLPILQAHTIYGINQQVVNNDKCLLLSNEKELNEKIKLLDSAFVLFYATWCPYSLKFLPIFKQMAEKYPKSFMMIPNDGNEDLFDKYSIEVFPTVLYFEKGKISHRLDGKAGIGLNNNNMSDFLKKCGC